VRARSGLHRLWITRRRRIGRVGPACECRAMTPSAVPFRGSHALAGGLVTDHALRHHYVRIYPDVYIHRDVPIDPAVRARAVWCWSGGRGVLAGWSAAAMLGSRWIDRGADGAIVLDDHRRPPKGLAVYRDALTLDDRVGRNGCTVTSPVRTAFDLARRLDLDTGIEAVDALYQATDLSRMELDSYTREHPGVRGVRRLRRVVELSDEGAESIWETRTRLAIVRSGLPQPTSQVRILDALGRFVARVDLCWPPWKVIVEYDGDQHFDAPARHRDIERGNALEVLGYRVIRVKARQLTNGSAVLLDQIRHVLRQAGAPV
jgi:very-short-patch-repair endonuclease